MWGAWSAPPLPNAPPPAAAPLPTAPAAVPTATQFPQVQQQQQPMQYTAAQFSAMTPEQQYAIQAHWQQWQKYQEEYAKWHAQYGEQYNREMAASGATATASTTTTPVVYPTAYQQPQPPLPPPDNNTTPAAQPVPTPQQAPAAISGQPQIYAQPTQISQPPLPNQQQQGPPPQQSQSFMNYNQPPPNFNASSQQQGQSGPNQNNDSQRGNFNNQNQRGNQDQFQNQRGGNQRGQYYQHDDRWNDNQNQGGGGNQQNNFGDDSNNDNQAGRNNFNNNGGNNRNFGNDNNRWNNDRNNSNQRGDGNGNRNNDRNEPWQRNQRGSGGGGNDRFSQNQGNMDNNRDDRNEPWQRNQRGGGGGGGGNDRFSQNQGNNWNDNRNFGPNNNNKDSNNFDNNGPNRGGNQNFNNNSNQQGNWGNRGSIGGGGGPDQGAQQNQRAPELDEAGFDRLFRQWEQQFEDWKKANLNHPDREMYARYEGEFERQRRRLIERRDQMRRRKMEQMGGQGTPSSTHSSIQPHVDNTNAVKDNVPPPLQSAEKNVSIEKTMEIPTDVPSDVENSKKIDNDAKTKEPRKRKSRFDAPTDNKIVKQPTEIISLDDDDDDEVEQQEIHDECHEQPPVPISNIFKKTDGIPGLDLVDENSSLKNVDEKVMDNKMPISKNTSNTPVKKIPSLFDVIIPKPDMPDDGKAKVTSNVEIAVTSALPDIANSLKDPDFMKKIADALAKAQGVTQANVPQQLPDLVQDGRKGNMSFAEWQRQKGAGGGSDSNVGPDKPNDNQNEDSNSNHPSIENSDKNNADNVQNFGGPNQNFGGPNNLFNNNNNNNFGPNGPNDGGFGPNSGQFGPNFNNRFGPNNGPNNSQFGPNNGPNNSRFGPNDGPNFGGPNNFGPNFNNNSRFGPNNGPNFGGPNNFGPNFGGPNNSRFGPNDGPNNSRFGPNDGPNFGSQNFDNMGARFGPNDGPNNSRFGPNDGPNFGNMGGRFGPNDGPNGGGRFFPNQGRNFGGGNFGPNGPNNNNNSNNNNNNNNRNDGNQGRNRNSGGPDGPQGGGRGNSGDRGRGRGRFSRERDDNRGGNQKDNTDKAEENQVKTGSGKEGSTGPFDKKDVAPNVGNTNNPFRRSGGPQIPIFDEPEKKSNANSSWMAGRQGMNRAEHDDYYRPVKVIDYQNTSIAPKVIDYGHRPGGGKSVNYMADFKPVQTFDYGHTSIQNKPKLPIASAIPTKPVAPVIPVVHAVPVVPVMPVVATVPAVSTTPATVIPPVATVKPVAVKAVPKTPPQKKPKGVFRRERRKKLKARLWLEKQQAQKKAEESKTDSKDEKSNTTAENKTNANEQQQEKQQQLQEYYENYEDISDEDDLNGLSDLDDLSDLSDLPEFTDDEQEQLEQKEEQIKIENVNENEKYQISVKVEESSREIDNDSPPPPPPPMFPMNSSTFIPYKSANDMTSSSTSNSIFPSTAAANENIKTTSAKHLQMAPQIPSMENQNTILIDEIIFEPGRLTRPKKICIIIRGAPGSGKSYMARLIKEKESEAGGVNTRILSIDDYFLVENDYVEKCKKTGKSIPKKEILYEYEADMEETYIQYLIKQFKKTIADNLYDFIIIDCVNNSLRSLNEFYCHAKDSGFMPYIVDLKCDVETCMSRNIHKRTENDIKKILQNWNPTPFHYIKLDCSSLLENLVEMEDAEDMITENICSDEEEVENEGVKDTKNGKSEEIHEKENADDSIIEIKDDDDEEDESVCKEEKEDSVDETASCAFLKSKWESDTTTENLARLDGTNKLKEKHKTTMEDYLQMDDWEPPKTSKDGKKRVRWADIEEKRAQEKMRAIGFVVGQTDWKRMMDPNAGNRALNRTKYIERANKNRQNYRRF